MDMVLYRNNSLSNVVDKVLTNSYTVSGTAFVLPYDERFPKIRVTGVSNYDNYNYFQIGNKYYYITKVEWKTNQESILSGELDLLMTYKSYIRGLTCYLKRSENHSTPYVNDNMETLQANQKFTIINFPYANALQDDEFGGCYVLSVAQSGYSG